MYIYVQILTKSHKSKPLSLKNCTTPKNDILVWVFSCKKRCKIKYKERKLMMCSLENHFKSK